MAASKVVSQACGECRARKIKCDLQRPACGRCIKSRRRCPGYRDQLTLLFKDETQSVAQRTKATTHTIAIGRRTPKSIMEEALGKALLSNDRAQRGELFLPPMDLFVVDVQDRASCYFFEVFDWVGASTLVDGSFNHATDAVKAPVGERALLAGISAVGKASLANVEQNICLKESAMNDYVATLKLVKMAVDDAEQLENDSTLTAIFLLSLFEMVVGQGTESFENWLNHIEGAARLIEMRGKDELSCAASRTMFYAWRPQMIVCSLIRKAPVPSKLLSFSFQYASFTRRPDTASTRELTFIIARLARLGHNIDTANMTDSEAILSELGSIDAALTAWSNSISPSCYYDPVLTTESFQMGYSFTLTPHRRYSHKYPGIWVASMWNQYRTTRLQVYGMILAHLQPQAAAGRPACEPHRVQCAEIRSRMCRLANDICCSVPYILGLLGQDRRESPSTPIKSSMGGFMLLWPLTVAALADQHPSATSSFVLHCFDIIRWALGIHQAMVFRDCVLSSTTLYGWADAYDVF
ncbi:uncharacterized protein N7459_002982 [Penicillium hispanicum]|uniref:uncharacterized protein n=1 Tax=Penicillium hispanicum TaxID=1080232 RepID=UPI0025410B11|nr:uncharacterized protein N7459_002982 [Penicillium hispanicum]KAJ5587217.1 hypothetical protein N7459_002982 [Penicillium hispanicum]